jgi:hypothetical protein
MREALGMADGDMLDLRCGGRRTAHCNAAGAASAGARNGRDKYVPPGVSLADELNAERREAAKHE